MTALRVTVFNLIFYAFTFCIALALYALAKLSTQAAMQRLIKRWGTGVLWLLRVILDSRVEVRGMERLPEGGPRLLVAKHQSELDVVMLAVLFPNTSAVAMAELKKYPFFGPILTKLGVVLVAIDAGPQGRTQQVIDGAREIVAAGRPMIIYPEGELMKLGAKERYKRGAGHIYSALDVPAVPIAVSLGTIWPRREWTKTVGARAIYEVLEPIEPGLPMERFMAEVEGRIETATMALIRETASPEQLAAAEDRHARGVNNHDKVVGAPAGD